MRAARRTSSLIHSEPNVVMVYLRVAAAIRRPVLAAISAHGGDPATTTLGLPRALPRPSGALSLTLGRVRALFGYRTFHQKYQECHRKRQHGDHPKAVEIRKCRCLLLAHIFELLRSQLLQRDRIGGLV